MRNVGIGEGFSMRAATVSLPLAAGRPALENLPRRKPRDAGGGIYGESMIELRQFALVGGLRWTIAVRE
jgi:hypothetical protein